MQSLTDLSGKLGGLQSQNSELQKELSSLETSLEQNSQRLADVRTQVGSGGEKMEKREKESESV